MINNFDEDSNNQIDEFRKLIQDLDKKVSNKEWKFNQEMGIMKNIQVRNVRNGNFNKSNKSHSI
jgi:hypothetical protein